MEPAGQFDLSMLGIPLPELEAVAAPYRRKYTTDGAMGLPCHITVLYPFCSAEEWDDRVASRLAETVATVPQFAFTLGRLARFERPAVLYLEPTPEDGIVALIRGVAAAFPEYPPYRGEIAFDRIRPHATIAVSPPAEDLAAVERAFLASVSQRLPARVTVRHLSLFVKSADNWRQHASFRLFSGTDR